MGKKITQNGVSFGYAYDSRGSIASEKRGNLTTTYQYDALGQLIRVNDPHENATWVYNYDRGGNILSKVKYAYTTGAVGTAIETIPYVYGDSNWKDKLTSYNGQTITCDAIGNPTNDGTWSYTWEAGRQLKQMSTEGTSVSFEYDPNGMRVQKVVEQSWYPETTNYIYHGKLLAHMTVDYTDFDEVAHQDKLHFFYDEQNRPAKIEFNGTVYTYLHNLQGDIVGIVDNTGALVVEYKYDAWGKPLSTTGTLAGTLGKRNPFRYRGYVYDEETGLYWLKERYYCSKLGRFIHADTVYTSLGDLGSSNRYAYCRNSPIELADGNGNWPSLSSLLGGIAVAAVAVAAVAITVATCGLAAPVLAGVGVASTTVTTATIVAGAALTTAAVATTAAIVYELEPKDYTVYCLADPVTGEVQYVGRTKNYEQRMRAHRAPNSRTNKLIPVVRIDHLTYAEARGLEEIGMAYYHTRKFLNETGENLIRGIGLKNKNAIKYRTAGSNRCSYLYNKLSNSYLCWKEGIY